MELPVGLAGAQAELVRPQTCKGGHFTLSATSCAGSRQVCPASAPQGGTSCAVNCAAVKRTDGPCAYPRGVFCSCAFDSSQWKCTAPVADGCPDTMPDLGTACAHEGLDCNYGECVGPGWHERCSEGSWVHIYDQCTL